MVKFILEIFLFVSLTTLNSLAFDQKEQSVDELNSQAFKLVRSYPDSAKALLAKSLELAFEIEYYAGAATSLKLSAQTLMIQRKDLEALETFQRAIHTYNQSDSGHLNDKHITYRNMAAILSRNHNYKMALTYYDSALINLTRFMREYPEDAGKNNSGLFLTDLLYFKSIGLKKSGDLLEAAKTLSSLWENSEKTESHGRVLNQLGLINKDLENYNEAKYFYRQVLELQKVRPIDRGHALHNYGYALILEGKYDSAREYLENAINEWGVILSDNKTSNTALRGLFRSRLDLGECFFHKGQYRQAVEKWEKALSINFNLETDPELFAIHNWLQQTYMLFDIEKANEHGELYRKYRDQFLMQKTAIATNFEGQVFRLQLEEYENSRNHSRALISQQNSFYAYLIIGILTSILLFYLLVKLVKHYRHKRFQQAMYQIATKKNQ